MSALLVTLDKLLYMEQQSQSSEFILQEMQRTTSKLTVDPAEVDNVVLNRLIIEVQSEKENHLHHYNRQHNRHNR